MRHCVTRMVIVGSMLMLAVFQPAQAAQKNDPNREAIRRAQLQLRQLQDEKAALELEKANLGNERDALRKKTDELSTSVASANRSKALLEKEAQKLRDEQAKLTEEVTRLKKELVDSQTEARNTHNSLQQETNQKKLLEQSLSSRDQALLACEKNNQTLYQYHVELVDLAQKRGSLDVLLESEPIFGFKRVQIENLLEKYRDKLDEQKIRSTAIPQAPNP